jgi:hypothetical protein
VRLTISASADHTGATDPDGCLLSGQVYPRVVTTGLHDDDGELLPLPAVVRVEWLLGDQVALTDPSPSWEPWNEGGMLHASGSVDVGAPGLDGVTLTARLVLDDGSTTEVTAQVREPEPGPEHPDVLSLVDAGATVEQARLVAIDDRQALPVTEWQGLLDVIGRLDVDQLSDGALNVAVLTAESIRRMLTGLDTERENSIGRLRRAVSGDG